MTSNVFADCAVGMTAELLQSFRVRTGMLTDQAEQIIIAFGSLLDELLQHFGLGIGAENQANFFVPCGVDLIEFASARVNQFFQRATLLLGARQRQVGAFERIEHTQEVLAFAKNNLRNARVGGFFFFLVLNQIRTSHVTLLQPDSPKRRETGKSRIKRTKTPLAEKNLRARVIMFRGNGGVKFRGVTLCPMRHGLYLALCEYSVRSRSRGDGKMSAFTEHQDELEHYEQMFGKERGRLAVGLDRLTNALVLVGQHGVYCTSQRNPTVPAMDIRMIANELTSAKELVQSVMEELRRTKNEAKT